MGHPLFLLEIFPRTLETGRIYHYDSRVISLSYQSDIIVTAQSAVVGSIAFVFWGG
jgi:hypothetical protein